MSDTKTSECTQEKFSDEPIDEDWLKEVGFKWHQFPRQPEKQWLLWLGDAVCATEKQTFGRKISFGPSYEDIGIELSSGGQKDVGPCWFCWLRSDTAHRYSRFLHIRHLRTRADLIRLIEGITGQAWDPTNNLYGAMRSPEEASRMREEENRLDRRLLRNNPKWREIEKGESRGGALPEHLEAYEKAGLKNRNDL